MMSEASHCIVRFCSVQNWEEDETMEDKAEEGMRMESKVTADSDIEPGNESEEEWQAMETNLTK